MLRISPSASSACELLNSVSKVNSQVLTKCFRISGASSANLRKSTNQYASFCKKTLRNVGILLFFSHSSQVQKTSESSPVLHRPAARVLQAWPASVGFLNRSLLLHFGNGLFICMAALEGSAGSLPCALMRFAIMNAFPN